MTEPEMLSTPEERAELRAHNARQFAALDHWTQSRLRKLAELVAEIKADTFGQAETDISVRHARQLGALEMTAEIVLESFALDVEPEEPGR